MKDVNAIEVKRPTFNGEIIVDLPENMPEIKHNLGQLKEFAIKAKDFYSKLIFNDENISEATEEKKKINKLIDEVKRQRIDNVKAYKKPIEDFENTAKEIEKLLGEAKNSVQVFIDKAEDERKLEKKNNVIIPIINECINNAFAYDNIIISKEQIVEDQRWYNKTYGSKDIKTDVTNQIDEIKREQKTYEMGLEVIKSNLEAYNKLNDYDKYAERFKYTKDLTSILNDIKNAALEENKLKEVTGNVKAFDESVNINDIDNSNMFNLQNDIVEYTLRVKGTIDQFTQLREFIKSIGMEEL